MATILLRTHSLFEVLTALPYPVVLLWMLWTIFTPTQVAHLLSRKNKPPHLAKSGELMTFREILAVSCVGGFILLTFITAFCCWLTLRLAKVI